MSHPRSRLCLLLLGVALLFGYRLGGRNLENHDIIRNADIAAEMLRDGDWLLPRSCGTVYVEKPPLFLWCAATAGRVLGGMDALAARLPSWAAGLAMVAGTVLLGRFLQSWLVGLAAGGILATMWDIWFYARGGRDDLLFAALTLWALLALLWAAEKGRVWGWTAAGLCMAGAMLVKGPLGMLLPLVAYAAWRVTLGWNPPRRLWIGMAWAVLLALSFVGHYYYQVSRHARPGELREILDGFFLKENLERVRSGWDHRPKPFWFYLVPLFANTLPWGLLIPIAFVERWPKGWKGGKAEAFLLLWVALTVVGLSLSAGKQARYLLPLYPALAVLLARSLAGGLGQDPRCGPWAARTMWVFPPLLLAAAVWLAVWGQPRLPIPVHLPALVLAACAVYLGWSLKRKDLLRSVAGLALAFAVGAMAWERTVETEDEASATCKAFAEELRPALPAGEAVYLHGRDFFRSGLCYYLGRTLPILERLPDQGPPRWVLEDAAQESSRREVSGVFHYQDQDYVLFRWDSQESR